MNAKKKPSLIAELVRASKKEAIAFPSVFVNIEQRLEALFQSFPRKVQQEISKPKLKEYIAKMLLEDSKKKQGKLSERDYLECRKKLEEVLMKIRSKELTYNNLFGLWDTPPTSEQMRYNFAPLFYLHLGLSGGAFAIADKVKDRILLQYDRQLQNNEDIYFADAPFIQIPYRSPKANKNAKAIQKVLNAMYIHVRQSQTISSKTDYSPEFYSYMPHLLSEERKKLLLPYQKELAEGNFKMIHCGIGEILFHLFAWRMLFRKVQSKRISHKVSSDTFRAFNNRKYNFWEEVRGQNLPETSWINALENQLNPQKSNGSPFIKEISETWEKYFVNDIDLSDEIQDGKVLPYYTMWKEYELMGMTKKDEAGTTYFTREFLEMVRYTIHICCKGLGWQAALGSDDDRQHILISLQTLEQQLNAYYQLHQEKHNPASPLYPSYANLKNYLPIIENRYDKVEGKRINDCLLRVAKAHLMKGETSATLSELLSNLHKTCSFPIIPYYYGLVTSKRKQPKEHLVLCAWNSSSNHIDVTTLHDGGTSRKETGIAFVMLTLNPVWSIRPEFNFTVNGNGIHYERKLSDEAFIRLMRLHDLFSLLARPIIDGVFYNRMIKRLTIDKSINIISHELKKITGNFFNLSNIPIQRLFRGKTEDLAQHMAKQVHGAVQPSQEEVMDWLVIPDAKRFKDAYRLFMLWSQGRQNVMLDGKGIAGVSFEEFVRSCYDNAKEMQVIYSYSGGQKPQSYGDFIESQTMLKKDKEKLPELTAVQYNDKAGYPEFTFSKSNSSEVVSAQNDLIFIFLSVFSNTLSHIAEENEVQILFHDTDSCRCLVVDLINSKKPDEEGLIKRRGTQAVIETSLNDLNGSLLHFGSLASANRSHHHDRIAKMEEAEARSFWLTSFKIPIQHLFS